MEQSEVKQLAEKLGKTQHDLMEKLNERDKEQGKTLSTIKDVLVAIQKQNDDNAKKYADDPIKNAEIEKLTKKNQELEDKLKTDALKKASKEKYGTVEGLAKTMTDSETFKNKPDSFIQLAKSILDDPLKGRLKKAWYLFLQNPDHSLDYKSALAELKNSDVSANDSFIKKALTTVEGQQAGYFVIPELYLDIQKVLFETSPIRQVATVMSSAKPEMKFMVRTTLPTGNWGSTETASVQASDEQKYQEVTITSHTLSAYPVISLDMLEDSPINIENELRTDLNESFRLIENKAFIEGTGVKEPKGLYTYAKDSTATYSISKPLKMEFVSMAQADYDSNDADKGHILLANALLDLEGRLLSPYKQGAVYLISRSMKNVIRQIKDKNNQFLFSNFAGWGGFQGVPSIRDGMNGMINGYGILECDDLHSAITKTAPNNYPIYFGNFSKYTILDRIGLTLIMDNVTRPGYMKYFFRKRLGAGFKLTQGVKVLKIT